MSDQSVFDTLTRQKLRFDTPQGQITSEDLWDLQLTSTKGRANLDDIARALNKQLKASGDDVSFVTSPAKTDATVQIRFDIVKHVIDVKLAENAAARAKQESSEKKQFIMGILAQKKNDELMGKTPAELEAMLSSM